MTPAITFDHVTKTYLLYHAMRGGLKHFVFNLPDALSSLRRSRYTALSDTSFTVARGESVGVIGRNGAGKSTILALAAGVLRPSQGRVATLGRVAPLLELGGGFHHDLTGRENILLNGVLLGLKRRQVQGAMDRIIEFSELNEFIDEPIRVYSSGMLAKLGFSIVTQLNPEILLIDEVLAVGDIKFQKKCREVIGEFRRKGVSILFVSHNMDDVALLCDRVLWIDNHAVRLAGSPDHIVSAYLNAQSSS